MPFSRISRLTIESALQVAQSCVVLRDLEDGRWSVTTLFRGASSTAIAGSRPEAMVECRRARIALALRVLGMSEEGAWRSAAVEGPWRKVVRQHVGRYP